jgi:anti-anti-sigma regulatory factor
MPDGIAVDRTAVADGRLAFVGGCTPEDAARIEEAMGELLEVRPSEAIVDLTGMTHFSSSCIGSLVAFADEASRIGVGVAVRAAGRIGRILEMGGVASIPNVRLELRPQ